MNKSKHVFTVLIILNLLASSYLMVLANDKKDVSKLPYDNLLQLHDTISKKLPGNQLFFLRILSSNPEVKSSDLSLRLISKNETVDIKVDPWGYIDLPIRRDLVGQGAFIVANQPKGTMILLGEMKSQIPLRNRMISYKDLISPVLASKSVKEIAQRIKINIESAKYLNSLHLLIDQDGSKPVIIRLSNKEVIKLTPDKFGRLVIPIEDKLIKKNPVVEFPSDKVFFVTPCE